MRGVKQQELLARIAEHSSASQVRKLAVEHLEGQTLLVHLAKNASSDVRAEAVVRIADQTERVRIIIRDLKSFSRADTGDDVPVDIQRVLDSAINMAWNEIRHRAQLQKRCDHVALVRGNEARLGQVFLNLLVNAAQAIPLATLRRRGDRARPVHLSQHRGSGRRRNQCRKQPGRGLDVPRIVADRARSVIAAAHSTIAAGSAQTFDIVFCDLMMAQLSGMELFETVRRRYPGIQDRFVFMTGGAFTQQAKDFLGGVTNPVVEKPFDIRALRSLVNRRVAA